ncbi:glycoside hydrolase family 16 protein [Parabacteroides sp. 52]|uniref:glycoside hydrolase family 16 protein n=1 Tax=unclassified Parabacteroides TaxID=2649774 RepID=UPI0013D3E771|nr:MULTISPECIES: glycoside hydrolase family 16 protein [unclassified Parabacteroides]MDH6534387.1 beta-glucanase (GH16 family) [Parabacteroides sp. PM5-20]NDV54886.1 glycoside hydrolase family 16 protein [Parabacteroides sp. 52]
MKKTHYLSLVWIVLICCSICSCTQPQWKLVWEENFDQTDGLDPTYWSKIPRGRADWQNCMSDYDSLFAVTNGKLILRGIVNDVLPDDTASFLTGGIYTKDKYFFACDGRVEIKARLFAARGAWPAIWMLPHDLPWPMGGEIDIMERLNGDSLAYQTVHSSYTYTLGIKDPAPGSTAPIDPEDYNIYAVELYKDSLSFYINDKHTFTYPRIQTDKEGQYPFDHPFYLLIDMQLGGSWVGAVEPADLPVEMWVDWVRYYKK